MQVEASKLPINRAVQVWTFVKLDGFFLFAAQYFVALWYGHLGIPNSPPTESWVIGSSSENGRCTAILY